MADEITYIPYGLDEISQLDLYTALANDLPNFVSKYKWLLKPKNLEKFLKAYDDIMQGFAGATNEGGRWRINTNNTIDTESMSPKDREIYEHAAYYIQLQMAKMTPRKNGEEKKKEDLEKFDFKSSFNLKLLNDYYGGQSSLFSDSEQGWNSLDSRDTITGLRGIDKRRNRMIEALTNYSNSLKDNYNFEGTSFSDINDAKNKIQRAIDALKTVDNTLDDLDAFNALGLNYRSYFSNGGNEELTLEDGRKTTYLKYYQELLKKKDEEEKAKFELAKLKLANQYNRYKYYNVSKFNERPLTAEESNILHLNELVAKDTWDADDSAQIKLFFKLAGENGHLVPLSREELDRFGPTWRNRTLYLRKINGINGVYYDTVSGKYVKPIKDGLTSTISFLDILNLNNSEALEKKRLELQNSKKLKDEDWDIIGADTVSMLGDLVSLGGGYAGAIGGATTILSDLYSDVRRGKDFWDVTKNLAKNTAWGFAGLIPGAKLAKLGKRAAQLYALYNSLGIIIDPDVHKSWRKLINGEDFTSHDFENLKWTLHAATGIHNTARSHFSDNALQNKLGNKNKVIVETKDGKRTITTEQQNKINKAGGRGGQEAANKEFLKYVKAEAKEGSFEFNTEGRKWYNPSRYSLKLRNATSNETRLLGTPISASRITVGRMLVLDRNKPIIANPFSLNTYKNWWTSGGPNRGYTTMALGKTYLNLNNTKQNMVSTTEAPTSEISKTSENKSTKSLLSDTAKEYREMLKGNYSKNAIQGGTHKIGDMTIDVDIPKPGTTNGFVEITFKNGNKETIRFDTQKLLQENIAKIIKERRVQVDSSGKKTKVDAKEMGKILKSLKDRGFLKQGGQINSSLDTIIEDFIKNNNI